MITCPRNTRDKADIDTPPANAHGWLNRASALYRWAVDKDNNPSLTRTIVVLAKIALERAKGLA